MDEPTLISLPTSKWRVKLYRLEDRSWADTGTGLCWGEIDGDNAYLTVIDETDPQATLLRTKIHGPIQYQKQDTLIIWTHQQGDADHGEELALSFQEVTGCVILCEFLVYVHLHYDQTVQIGAMHASNEPLDLLTRLAVLPPLPTLENLACVYDRVAECADSLYGRDALSVWFLQSDYLVHVASLFETLEKATDLSARRRLDALHAVCDIVKTLFAMGENLFIDMLLEDSLFIPFLGMLEYDKEFGKRKANYRKYFETTVTFKEVLPIEDVVLDKIRKSFRLTILKDVVFARFLDDTLLGILSSSILMSHMEIIAWLQNNDEFLTKFFKLYTADTSDSVLKDDGVLFMTHMLLQSKCFQQQRVGLYLSLIEHGLLDVLAYGLKRQSHQLKSSSLESIKLLLDSEINVIESSKPVMCSLLAVCKQSSSISLQLQACDTLKAMLEPPTNPEFEKTFYESCAQEIFTDLTKPNDLSYDPEVIIDFLGFCLKHHHHHNLSIDRLLCDIGLWNGIANMLGRDKLSPTALISCIRCLKYMVQSSTVTNLPKLVASGALGLTLDLVARLGNTNNLLQSSCYDLLVAMCERKYLCEWMLEHRRSQLEQLTFILPIAELLEGREHAELEPLSETFNEPLGKRTSSVGIDNPSQRFKTDDQQQPVDLIADETVAGPGTPRPKKPARKSFASAGQPAKRMVSFEDAERR